MGKVEAKKGAGKKQEKSVASAFGKSGSKERRGQEARKERCLRFWEEWKLRKAQARSKKREMPALFMTGNIKPWLPQEHRRPQRQLPEGGVRRHPRCFPWLRHHLPEGCARRGKKNLVQQRHPTN